MQLHQLPDHGQPEPGALETARKAAVDLGEGVEQFRQAGLGDADSLVANTDLDELLVAVEGGRENVRRPVAGEVADLVARNALGADQYAAAMRAELHGVRQQVVDDLLGLAHVQVQCIQPVLDVEFQPDPLPCGLFANDAQTVGEQAVQVHWLQLERHHSRFDLGQVQDVVDQRQQVLPAAEDVADVFALVAVHLADHSVLQGLRETDDGVQGRAQFVRHGRQELGFHPAGVHELDVLFLERLFEAVPLAVAGGFDLLAHGVVGADQQVADDFAAGVAQRCHRHDGREPAAVLAHIGQLVDVLDAARGLEHQRLEAGRDRGVELQAERRGARDQFLRVRDVSRGDLVDHVLCGVAEHPLGTDVEDLDHALFVGGDAGEVGTVEDGVLQGAGLERGLATRCDDGFGIAGWRSQGA